MTGMEFADLELFVRPRRVAVVGASDKPGSLGYSTYNNVRNHSQLSGGAVPVNPRYEAVMGDVCFPSVSEIPGDAIDVAIVLVSADQVVEVARDCAKAGVRFLLVLSSGFSETGADGRSLQAELLEVAGAAGMRIYGPNSPGLANVADGVLLSMSPVAAEDVTAGPVGLVTQGGGIGRALMQWMDRGLGIGLWASPGNESDLDLADFVNHLLDDSRIRVIGCVVEGFAAGPKFLRTAARARAMGKPIVMLKIGRSEYGQQTAASHTASLAGNDAVASALFVQYGVVRVDDVDELGATLHLFSRALQSERDVTSTCVYSFSGGAASLGADLVGAAGLRLAQFGEGTRQTLRERAPAFGFVENPVDLTTKVFTDAGLNRAVFEAICQDPAVGSILFAMPADYGESTSTVTRDAIVIARDTDTVLIPVWMSPRRGQGFELLDQSGLAPFAGVGQAVTALRRFAEWRNVVVPSRPDAVAHGVEPAAKVLSERAVAYGDAYRVLTDGDLRLPSHAFAETALEASEAAEWIGGSVVLKLSAPSLIHKTEVGGVRVGIRGGAEAAKAFEELVWAPALTNLGIKADGVFVQEMMPDGIDLLVSAHADEVFGPVVTVGAGGVATEVERDVAHLALPFTDEEFEAAVRRLRVWHRLRGFRGAPASDLRAVADAVRKVGAIYLGSGGQLTEVEINPLRVIVGAAATECVVLDAMLLTA
jgi:acyl-CoA synthetase (NDP forming)